LRHLCVDLFHRSKTNPHSQPWPFIGPSLTCLMTWHYHNRFSQFKLILTTSWLSHWLLVKLEMAPSNCRCTSIRCRHLKTWWNFQRLAYIMTSRVSLSLFSQQSDFTINSCSNFKCPIQLLMHNYMEAFEHLMKLSKVLPASWLQQCLVLTTSGLSTQFLSKL